jgi:hypothetical protein
MTILMVMFLFSGLILAGLSIPMILGKIPPNGLYGFRVKKTMENPDIWYKTNTYSGKWLLAGGLLLALVSVGFTFIPGLALDGYSYAVLVVWVAMFAVIMIASVRYLKSL